MRVSCEFDEGIGARAALGLIVLQKDETLETELRSALPEKDVALFHSRIPSDDEVTPETLYAMAASLPGVVQLLPDAGKLDVVAYGCTSAATVIGQDRVAEIIEASHPRAAITDPISAVIAGCLQLRVQRLAMLTPYTARVADAMRLLLLREGLSIETYASFDQSNDPAVARIATVSIAAAAVDLGKRDDVDAVFVSCTNLRSFSILDDVEQRIGKPVISSNAALAWHMRTLAGLGPLDSGPGTLLRNGNDS